MLRLAGLFVALLAAGCAEQAGRPDVAAGDKPVAAEAPAGQKIESQPLKYLKNRTITPQPTRPLNVRSRCSHKDAIGTMTRLDLLVREAEVKAFDAQVTMKGYGTCRFNLKDFDQVEKLPQALLKARNGSGCSVRMWEQGPKVTIAFNGCPKSCEGDAFSYLWPIMVEAKSGRCF